MSQPSMMLKKKGKKYSGGRGASLKGLMGGGGGTTNYDLAVQTCGELP